MLLSFNSFVLKQNDRIVQMCVVGVGLGGGGLRTDLVRCGWLLQRDIPERTGDYGDAGHPSIVFTTCFGLNQSVPN